MVTLIFLFLISGLALILWSFNAERPLRLSTEVKKEMESEVWYTQSIVKKPLVFTRPFLALNRMILAKFGRQGLLNKLSFVELNLLPEDFLGIKYLIIIVLLVVTFISAKRLEPLWVVGIVLVGYFIPDLYIRSLIQKRKRTIVKLLPDAVDLLTLCVEGGLDLMIGINWVIKRTPPNPLTKELSLLLHEVRMGRSRHDALKAMAKRTDLPEMYSLVNTLIHADRMGTPIADVLNNLSEDARRRRFQRAERLALQAPIKMLLPLIFFILPVVGIIVGAPILIQFMGAGGMPKF